MLECWVVQVSNQLGLPSSICWIWHHQSSKVSCITCAFRHFSTFRSAPQQCSTEMKSISRGEGISERSLNLLHPSEVNRKTVFQTMWASSVFSVFYRTASAEQMSKITCSGRIHHWLSPAISSYTSSASGWLWPKSTSVCRCFSNSRHTQPSRKQLNFECVRSDCISHEKFAVQSALRFGRFCLFHTALKGWEGQKATTLFVKCFLMFLVLDSGSCVHHSQTQLTTAHFVASHLWGISTFEPLVNSAARWHDSESGAQDFAIMTLWLMWKVLQLSHLWVASGSSGRPTEARVSEEWCKYFEQFVKCRRNTSRNLGFFHFGFSANPSCMNV